MNAAELQALADDRLEKYHFYRPHEALGGLTRRSSPLHSACPFPTRSVL